MKVLRVLRLPRKTSLRCSKCCACYAKRAGGVPSAAPATQNEAAPKVINCGRISADLYEGAPSAAPATPHLPRKTSRRCSKCCACHAEEAMPKVISRRTSTDLYEAAPSAAPATQNECEVLQVLRLPRKNEAAPKVINCRRTSADLYEGAP